MRTSLLLASASFALAAIAACASSEETEGAAPPAPEAPVVPAPEAGTAPTEDAGAPDGSIDVPTCSAEDWCATPLLDADLVIKDIWPLASSAFAIAESPTLGVKVLEWEDASSSWKYIDDETQNEPGFGKYAGAIWSPGPDEVYFGVSPATIYHGRRLAPPESGFSWSRQQLDDNSFSGVTSHAAHDHGYPSYYALGSSAPALGVWGSAADDVYAWYSNTIFHRTLDDAGAPSWEAEYVAGDGDVNTEHLFFVSASGTGRDNIWFSGARSRGNYDCALVVRKTPDGYHRIADGIVRTSINDPCLDRDGFTRIGGAAGWLTDIQPLGQDGAVGLKGTRDVVRLVPEGDGYSIDVSTVPRNVPSNGVPTGYSSLWTSSNDIWLTGWGLVLRSPGLADAGEYQVSTVSLNGAPINRQLHKIRGASDTNLWATGARYAFHKTTP